MCTDTLHISGAARRLTQSRGNYTTWAKRRGEQQLAYDKEAGKREAEIERMKEFAGHGYRYGGSSSAIGKMKQLAKAAGYVALNNVGSIGGAYGAFKARRALAPPKARPPRGPAP